MIASRSAYSASSISGAAASPTGDQSVRTHEPRRDREQEHREAEPEREAGRVVGGARAAPRTRSGRRAPARTRRRTRPRCRSRHRGEHGARRAPTGPGSTTSSRTAGAVGADHERRGRAGRAAAWHRSRRARRRASRSPRRRAGSRGRRPSRSRRRARARRAGSPRSGPAAGPVVEDGLDLAARVAVDARTTIVHGAASARQPPGTGRVDGIVGDEVLEARLPSASNCTGIGCRTASAARRALLGDGRCERLEPVDRDPQHGVGFELVDDVVRRRERRFVARPRSGRPSRTRRRGAAPAPTRRPRASRAVERDETDADDGRPARGHRRRRTDDRLGPS